MFIMSGAPEIQKVIYLPENRDYGRVTVPDRNYAEVVDEMYCSEMIIAYGMTEQVR